MVAAELAAVAVMGVGASWLVGLETLPAMGLAALVYYPAANLCVDRKLGIRPLRTLVRSSLPGAEPEPQTYEEIEGREELQVSF